MFFHWFLDKDARGYVGSVGYIFLVFVTLAVFAVYEVPEGNADIINFILGMLLGSTAQVVATLIGRDSTEIERLKSDNELLIELDKEHRKKFLEIKSQLSDLQYRVIEKLSIIGKNYDIKWYDDK